MPTKVRRGSGDISLASEQVNFHYGFSYPDEIYFSVLYLYVAALAVCIQGIHSYIRALTPG